MLHAIYKFSTLNSKQLKVVQWFSSYKTLDYMSNNDLKGIKTDFHDNHFEIKASSLTDRIKKYPYIWLRDHCRCKSCYDSVNNQILVDLKQVSLDLKPKFISDLDQNSNIFNITWTDGHNSSYDLKQLGEFAFQNDLKRKDVFYWNKASIKDKLNELKFNYDDYMNNDEVLKKSLEALTKYGFMIVNNIPLSIENSKKAMERISYIQKTLYGEITILTANGAREDSSYSNIALKAHHDCTYLKNSPGLEIFQLLKHDGKGGETLLVDGFYCANKLKELHQEDFDALTKINVKAVFKEKGKYEVSHVDPVIKMNSIDSSLFQIRYNTYDREILNYLTYDETLSYYKAMKNFGNIIETNENELWFQLKQGELLFFDNFRILHGRSQFTGERQLMTCYIPRDEWISKAIILNNKN